MEFENNLPIYQQIVDELKKKIVNGELKPGDKLPAIREIANELKVNPNTIQRSYSELEREGLLIPQRGTGSFITDDIKAVKELKIGLAEKLINNFINEMKQLGFEKIELENIIRIVIEEVYNV